MARDTWHVQYACVIESAQQLLSFGPIQAEPAAYTLNTQIRLQNNPLQDGQSCLMFAAAGTVSVHLC